MIVISQPRYLPALNYIKRLKFADTFVLLDNVQRQSRGWENRNQIIENGRAKWLSIPISSSSREVICKTQINGFDWIEKHKIQLFHAYQSCSYFDDSIIEKYFEINIENNSFVDFIEKTLRNLSEILDFNPNLKRSSQIFHSNEKFSGPDLLLNICKNLDDDTYVSGPNGRDYGIEESFFESGIKIKYHQFEPSEYSQIGVSNFIPYMAFFDFIFNKGLDELKKEINRNPRLL